MKYIVTITLICFLGLQGHALTYYSKSTGNLNTLGTWGILTNGSGLSPLNFTTAGDVFIIVNNAAPTISASWTVSGTITVGDGSSAINFTVPAGLKVKGTVNVTNNATITIGTALASATAGTPAFGTLSTGSTVVFNGSGSTQVIPVATYYNLTINNSAGIDLGTNIKETINGTLNFLQGDLQLNTSKLVLNGTVSGMSATKCFTGNNGGTGSGPDIFIQTSGNCGTIYMNPTTINNTDRADSFVVNAGASVTLGSDMTIKSAYVLNGTLNDGGNRLYIRWAMIGTGTQTGGGVDSFANSGSSDGTNPIFIGGVTTDNIYLNDCSCNNVGFQLTGSATVTGTVAFLTGGGSTKNKLSLNGNTLTLSGAVSGMSAANSFTGSSTSNLTVNSSGSVGTIYLDQTTAGTTNKLGTFTNNTGGTTTLGNTIVVNTTLALTAGTLANGGNPITLAGNITGTGTESGTGTITMNASGKTVSGATISNLTFANAGGFSLSGDPTITGALTFSAGKLSLAGNTLTLNGTVASMSATNSITGSATSDIVVGTSGSVGTIYLNQTTPGTTNLLNSFTNNTTGVTTLGNDLAIGSTLALTNGILNNNGNDIALAGSITGTATETGAGIITMSAGGSTISGATISNLTLNNAGTVSLTGDPTFTGALTFSAGKLSIGAHTLTVNGTLASMTAANSLTGGASSNLTIGGSSSSLGTLFMDQTTDGTTNKIATFTLNRTLAGGGVTLGNKLAIGTSITFTAGILTDAGNAIDVFGNWTNNLGTAAFSSTGTVTFKGTSAQTIGGTGATNFNNLTNSNTSAALLVNTNENVSGTLNMNGSATILTPGAAVVINSGAAAGTISGNGTIQVTRIAATADYVNQYKFATNTLSAMTVDYTGAGAQTMNSTVGNYGSLKTSTSGTKTMQGAISVNNNVTIGSGTTFDASASSYQLNIGGSYMNNGTFTCRLGAVYMTGTTTGLTLSGAMTGTSEFNSLVFLGGAAAAWSFSNDAECLGTFNISTGTVTAPAAMLTVHGNWWNGATFTNNGGTVAFNNTVSGITMSGTVNMTGTSKFNNVTLTGSGGSWTYSPASMEVAGNFSMGTGTTLVGPSSSFLLAGNWSNSGTYTHNSGTVTLNGSSQQTLSGSSVTTFNNLTLNNSAGAKITADESVNGTLTLTSGRFDIGANILTLGNGTPAVGGGPFSATKMIVADGGGEIRKSATTAAQATYTFPIGDNTGTAEYSPVTLTFSGGAYAGYCSAKVINSKHPGNANTTNYLKRYWTVKQSGFSGPWGCIVAATYLAADVVGAQGSIIMGKWDGATPWAEYTGSNSGFVLTSPTTTFSDFTGLNQNPPSVSAAPANPTVCAGNSVILTATGIGDATLTYSWSPSSGLSATTGASVTASPALTTIYTVTVTDGNGFTATNTATVNVTPIPTAAPTNNGPICIGGTVNLTANAVGATSYTWSGPNLSSTTGATTSATPAANAVYSLVATNGACSSTVYTTGVSVVAKPTAVPTNDGPICTTGTVNLTANPAGGVGAYTYSWSGSSLSSGVAANPSATPASGATYSLTVSNAASGCVSTVYATAVAVASQPSAVVSNNSPICNGGTVTLSSTPSGGTGAYIYNWTGANLASTTMAGPTATPTSTAVYSLTIANAASGCNPSTVYTTSATVNAKPSAAPTNNGPICTTGTVNLAANATGGVGAYIYSWSGSGLSSSTAANPTATPAGTAIYSLTVSNAGGGCSSGTVYTTTAAVNAQPSATPANDGPICTTGTVNLAANASGGAGSYIYTWSGSNLASTTTATPSATPASSGVYSLTIANAASGCNPATVYTTAVTVASQPSAAPTNDGPVCTSGLVHFTAHATGGTGAYSYTWSGPNLAATTAVIASANPTSTSVYSVIVTNAASGCNPGTAYTTSVSVNAVPAASPAASAICNGGTASLSANASNGVGAYIYSWSGPNLSSATVAAPTATPTVTSTYSVTVSNTAAGCSSGSSYVMTATVNPLPAVYNVTGGGTYCQGGTIPHVTLSGSGSGCNYQLYKSGALVTTMAGTGAALDFGSRAAGFTFTVVGVNASTGCNNNMTGSTTIAMNTAPNMYTMTGGGAYCAGDSGVHVGLSNSDAGFSYQLYNATSAMGSPLSGSGAALDFGLQTTAGTAYYVVSTNNTTGCTKMTTSSAGVSINPLPWSFAMTGSSTYCTGGTGSVLGLYSTVTGTNYQLYLGYSPVGSPIAGTGTTINFGYQSAIGLYTVVGTNTVSGCVGPMSGSVSLGVGPLPTAYVVTGGGAYCSGGAGLHVGLANSDAGVTYQLYKGSTPVGSAVSGTGAPLDFGLQTAAGSYSVIATSSSMGCSGSMSNTVSISISSLPAVYSVTGGGGYCSGGPGVHVGLSNSTSGTSYQLYKGASSVGSPLSGTGAALDFGYQTTAGTYTVTANNGCGNTMSGSATVAVNALPAVYSMTGGGSYCAGGTGVMVYLTSTQYGVNYQLYDNGSVAGSPVAGTGVILNFGIQTSGGTYSVVAANATTGCSSNMSNTVSVTVNALPNVYSITGGGAYCSGSSGVAVGLSNSQSGVSYQLYGLTHAGPAGSPVAGNGSAISFGQQTIADVYSVTAVDNASGCTSGMTGTDTITINPLPTAVALTGGGYYCSGSSGVHIGLSGSAVGIDYQLYQGGLQVGTPLAGIGSSLDFGLQAAVGSYTVMATNAVTSCTQNMTGSVAVSVNALPAGHTVTGGGYYCPGGSGVTVGLNSSDAGVSYQLHAGGSPLLGTIHAGTGSAISFGLQTTTGTYSVIATDTLTGCTNTMSGNASIANYAAATTYTVTGGGSSCAAGSGLAVGLSNSDATVSYQLYLGTTAAGSAVSGTGSALSFGSQTASGSYSVVATSTTGCSTNMAGTATISINSLPFSFTVLGTASACSSTGADVELSSSVTGTEYQLYSNGAAVGSPMSGTGTTIDYGMQMTSGTYTVVATNAITGCSTTMTGSAVLTINPTPSISGTRFTVSRSGLLHTTTLSPSLTGGDWTSNDPTLASVGSSTGVVTGIILGTTTITYTMPTGCYATQGVSVTLTGHREADDNNSAGTISNGTDNKLTVNIVPNPNKGIFIIKGTTGNDKDSEVFVEITDMTGRAVYVERITVQNGTLDQRVQLDNNIANGMYLLNLSTEADKKVFHIVVER